MRTASGTENPTIDGGFAHDRLHWLLDSISDYAIYMLTPEGEVASWNAGATTITGYPAAEAIGLKFERFFTLGDVAKGLPSALLKEALQKGRAETEGWQIRKVGTRFWATMVLHPARNGAGDLVGFAQVTRDITERRAAQQSLFESERRFRLLVEGVTDYAIYLLDPSGIVTNWNAGAQRMKGYLAEEIVGQHFSRFYGKEDRAAGMPARVLETAAREGRFEAEGWRYRKDGSRFWASVVVDAIHDRHGELIGFGKVTRDISERKMAQEALRSSERQFRLLVDGVRDYAVYMLDPNGVVASWNSGAERIKGYRAKEIVGQHFSRFYTEDDRAAGGPARALSIAGKEGRYEAEGWRVRKDGTIFWANVVIARIQDEQGGLLGFAKITRDITERREAQQALLEAQAQRTQAQKMEALGHLTGGVAHDFNNLLMIISGQNQVLKRLSAADPKGPRAAEAVETAIARGASLTRQLLTFSRRQTLNPRVVALPEHIESFKAMLTGTMGGMNILTNVMADVWPVIIDPNELELSLLNLSINARDAMPTGGSITITAENAHLSAGEVAEKVEGEFVAITVADTGTGIAPDILSKIFDPFFTTKGVNKGSGLGLSQVHGFTHQSGGTVKIDSELGRGTRITLYLPRAFKLPETNSRDDASYKGSGLVLVVEDNPDVANATRNMLEQLGYQVDIAGDAAAALQALDIVKPTLVMSDIVMPGDMDGFALAEKIRELHPALPIVLATGYAKNARADLAFPIIRKPYNIAELGRTIRSSILSNTSKGDNLFHLHRPGNKAPD